MKGAFIKVEYQNGFNPTNGNIMPKIENIPRAHIKQISIIPKKKTTKLTVNEHLTDKTSTFSEAGVATVGPTYKASIDI